MIHLIILKPTKYNVINGNGLRALTFDQCGSNH